MVGTDPVEVERQLIGGALVCPGCAGVLRPWGWARGRIQRTEQSRVAHRPRRGRCSGCASTHVLLPASALLRRADAVSVIWAGLLAKAAGAGHRVIAAALGRPAGTVRGWLRRFAVRAEGVRVLFTGLLHALDPAPAAAAPAGSVFADALEAVGRAAAAAVVRLGPVLAWEFASRATGGRLLAPPAAAAARVGAVSNTS